MSTTETTTPFPPGTAQTAGPVRRSILPKGRCPAPTAALPALPAATLPAAASADWRGQAVTEELPAVPARRSALPRRPASKTTVRRHLRAALVGTLLAIVAITGLSAYAAQGITDARSSALCQARIACK